MPLPPCAAVFVDVTRKGALLDTAVLSATYPDMQAGAGGGGSDPRAQLLQACGVPAAAVWVDLARTMVLAHQRRGESDDVAHWIYQLLALDPQAQEWQEGLKAVS